MSDSKNKHYHFKISPYSFRYFNNYPLLRVELKVVPFFFSLIPKEAVYNIMKIIQRPINIIIDIRSDDAQLSSIIGIYVYVLDGG